MTSHVNNGTGSPPHATFAWRLTPAFFISVFRPEEVQKNGVLTEGNFVPKKRKIIHSTITGETDGRPNGTTLPDLNIRSG